MGDMQKMAEFLSESMYLYDSADIQKQDKTTVRDQINTVRKNKQAQNTVTRWRKFTDENAYLGTQKSGSNWIEGIYYSFISSNFSKAGRRLFVHTH